LEDHDPILGPVLDHIERYGLVLANEVTVDTAAGRPMRAQ